MKTLTNSADINDILKGVKKKEFMVLYVSPWCTWSSKIMNLCNGKSFNFPLYIINSWDTPEAFGTYKIMSAPALLVSNKGRLSIITEYSSVHKFISGLESEVVEDELPPKYYRNK